MDSWNFKENCLKTFQFFKTGLMRDFLLLLFYFKKENIAYKSTIKILNLSWTRNSPWKPNIYIYVQFLSIYIYIHIIQYLCIYII